MRKNFIDNIRFLIILLLFPFHTIFVYNGVGVDFYILQPGIAPITYVVISVTMWVMPILFLLAGCSARYSLERRTLGQYVKERFTKLLLPMAAGMVIIQPVSAYYAERFQCGFTGSIFDEYAMFFTGTGNTSFDNGFNLYVLNHFWFIYYLLIISLATLPLVALFVKKKFGFSLDKAPGWAILVFGGAAYVVINIPYSGAIDKNIFNMALLFMLGYYSFSRDDVQLWLSKIRWILLAAALAVFVLGWAVLWSWPVLMSACSWLMMMAVIGWAFRLLNKTNRVFKYFITASYGLYFFHMPWVVVFSYYLITAGASPTVHIVITTFASFGATVATYELVRRIPPLRYIFALRAPKKAS